MHTSSHTYNQAIQRIEDRHEAGVHLANQRKPGVIHDEVGRKARAAAYIINLGNSYRKIYDNMFDNEEEAQKRFDQKMQLIIENARYDNIVI